MPDDPMFTPGAEGADGKPAAAAAGAPAGGNGADPNPTQTLTPEQAVDLINQATSPIVDRMEALGAAIQRIGQPQQNQQADDPVDDGDFLTRFSNDPEGTLQRMIAGEFRTISPVMSSLVNSATGAFLGLEAQQIDAQFGAGAWDKFFEKPVTKVLDQYREKNPALLSDRNTITREVNGLKGVMFDDLVTYRDESRKSMSAAELEKLGKLTDGIVGEVANRTNLTGGIRRIEGTGNEVTEDVKNYLAERSRNIGKEIDPKDWVKETSYIKPGEPTSLEDYLAHKEASEGDS